MRVWKSIEEKLDMNEEHVTVDITEEDEEYELVEVTGWQRWVLENILVSKVRVALITGILAIIAAGTEAAVSWLEYLAKTPA